MATGPCEVLESNEECPNSVKGLSKQKESIQQQLKEDRKEDAKIPTNKEEVNGTPNGIEKEGKNKLHVIEQDLDEFVDSMTEAVPEGLPDTEKYLSPEQVPEKLPRAEQVAENVLRAKKVTERAPGVEKLPGTEKGAEKSLSAEKVAEKVVEKVPEKVPRGEKAVEKAPRAEKPAEKTRPTAPKTAPAKRKAAAGPAKDTLPWEGLTLNKCILIACCLALLSVSCQVVQDVLDFGSEVPLTEPGMPTPLESSPQEGGLPGEQEELWFYERWLMWPEDYEPPEPEEEEEEELELEEIEEEEADTSETEEEEEEEPTEEEEEPTEEEEEPTEEEEEPEVSVPKAEPRKSREKMRGEVKSGRREKSFRDKAPKDHKAHEEEGKREGKLPWGKRHHRESSEKEQRQHPRGEGKSHPPKPKGAHFKEHKQHPQDEGKGRRKEGRDRSEGRGHPRQRQDYKPHPHEFKGRKPWHVQRPFFSEKDAAHKFGKHKFPEGKRHD